MFSLTLVPVSASESSRRNQNREEKEIANGGDSPLHSAARRGDDSAVEDILKDAQLEDINKLNR